MIARSRGTLRLASTRAGARVRCSVRVLLFVALSLPVGDAGAAAQRQEPGPGVPDWAVGVRSAGRAGAAVAFRDVTVVDVATGRLLSGRTVIVSGTRIRAVGPAGRVRIPGGARVVNAHGRYLIPGLWDMHVHFTWPSPNPDVFYPLLVANGVTGIRDPGMGTPLDTVRQWRRAVAAGTRVGPPRQLVTGHILEGGECGACIKANTPDEARAAVASLARDGADFIKLHNGGMSRDAFFAAVAAARAHHLPILGHLPVTVAAVEASDSGMRSFEHAALLASGKQLPECLGDSATVGRCSWLARRLARNGTWIVPTVTASYMGSRLPEHVRPYLPAWLQDAISRFDTIASAEPSTDLPEYNPLWGRSLDIMQRAGMPLLAGTDAGTEYNALVAGFSLHSELALLVAKGVTPLGALQAATLNPAKYLRGTDSLGTVAAGKLADLVLLDANPLEDIRNTSRIRAVVADGRYFDRAALDSLLVQGKAEAAWRESLRLAH